MQNPQLTKSVVKRRRRVIIRISNILRTLAADLEIGPSDLQYALKRLTYEGPAFVTKILPCFAKFAIRCCEAGEVQPTQTMTNFGWRGSALPKFLSGLLVEAIAGSPAALYRIRQFCEYFYKTAFGFSSEDLEQARDKYLGTDKKCGKNLDLSFVDNMRKNFHTLFGKIANATVADVLAEVRPYDGPGSFAGSSEMAKLFDKPYEVIKKYGSHVIGSHPSCANAWSGYFRSYPSSRERLRSVSASMPAELLFVPKDSRGPRTISKEPLHLLRLQMAFGKWLSDSLELHSRQRINFADQSINQELARVSSITRENSTLDLKDASDLVSLKLVRALFRYSPALRYAVTNARSVHCVFPDGTLRVLSKFANMGSGLCFPVLSLVVYLAVVTGLKAHGVNLQDAAKQVYVYGDDLIVPTQYYQIAIDSLTKAGLAVNSDKSFSKGFFRESCGGDFYHGVQVAPARLRLSGADLKPISDYRQACIPVDPDRGVLQIERHCRELVDHGLYKTAYHLYLRVLGKLTYMPRVERTSPVLGVYDPYGLIPLGHGRKGYIPTVVTDSSKYICPYKLMGPRLRGGTSEADIDPYAIPLRYKVKLLKKTVLEDSDLFDYGLRGDPRQYIRI